MDFSFTDNDKEVIKKTKFVLNFQLVKLSLGPSWDPLEGSQEVFVSEIKLYICEKIVTDVTFRVFLKER